MEELTSEECSLFQPQGVVLFLNSQNVSSYQLNSKDNGLVLLLKTVLRLLVIFPHLSSVASDGKDKRGLKL